MKRLLFFISLLLTAANYCSAITETNYFTQVDSLCFNFYNDGTAELVGKSISAGPGGESMWPLDITGDFEIPKTVDYEGKTYRVTRLCIDAVDCCDLNSLTIPETIEVISRVGIRYINYNSQHIKKMYIPSWEWYFKMREEKRCFDSFPQLFQFAQDIYINNEHIDKWNIVIPEGTELIPRDSFTNLEGLNSITLPKSIKAIGSEGHKAIDTNWCAYIVSYIEDPQDVFINNNDIGYIFLYVPLGTKEKYQQTYPWNEAQAIIEFDPKQGKVELPDAWPHLHTNIENQQATDAPAALYDLSGRRLTEHPRQGLYIRNGKKYLWPGRRR